MNLCTDVVCDRFMEEEVFDDSVMDRTDLVLIDASHLANIARNINPELWKILDLTHPGWRINGNFVSNMVEQVTDLAASVNMESATVVLQLFDYSVYMVGGPGGEKRLPGRDRMGIYHIDGSLVVADKAAVKTMVNQLSPPPQGAGLVLEIFLTPLARYWVAPCCSDPGHVVNYCTAGFQPKLGNTIVALRDYIRDALFVKKVPIFQGAMPEPNDRRWPTEAEAYGRGGRQITGPLGPGSGPPHRCSHPCDG